MGAQAGAFLDSCEPVSMPARKPMSCYESPAGRNVRQVSVLKSESTLGNTRMSEGVNKVNKYEHE